MNFVTFLLYFIGARLIYDFIAYGLIILFRYVMIKRAIKKAQSAKETGTQLITMEDLLEKVQESKKGEDDTWH